MELGKRVNINNKKFNPKMRCLYYSMWNNIPLYVTSEYDNVYAILNKDKSCMIVVGKAILNMYTPELIECALWHEVSHLYYRDTLDDWNINYEYRADMVAVRATSITSVINSLQKALPMFKTTKAITVIQNRIDYIKMNNSQYILGIEPMQMLVDLKPVTIRQ